jgi:hypothetical protein
MSSLVPLKRDEQKNYESQMTSQFPSVKGVLGQATKIKKK